VDYIKSSKKRRGGGGVEEEPIVSEAPDISQIKE
jgi:hypothetical protein